MIDSAEAARIGVLGGTFDPVHLAHLRIALDIKSALKLSQVRFIPNRVPPHRQQPEATAEQRLQMLRLALAPHDDFFIDECELERSGPSYMVDTLRILKKKLPGSLYLILGTDAFYGLEKWHQWEQLWDYAHIVVAHRPDAGSMPESLANAINFRQVESETELFKHSNGNYLFCRVTQLEVSATRIRKLISKGEDVKYLTPDGVIDFIQQQNIYSQGTIHAVR